jgi:IS1 family transposase
VGDVWTFTAICADTKICPTWLVGARDGFNAELFMRDLESRLAERVQLTTDGYTMYLEAVDRAFGIEGVDYAMLQKKYGSDPEPQRRYSPAKCTGATKVEVRGNPEAEHINTSYVERQNLTMRMSMRRFTRLTNAFSKKIENHAAAVALHFAYYNFCRPHQSLRTKNNNRVTPAMAAGVTKRQWSVEDLVSLLPEAQHRGGRPKKAS